MKKYVVHTDKSIVFLFIFLLWENNYLVFFSLIGGTSIKKIFVPLSMNENDFHDLLTRTFPVLRAQEIELCKVDRHRRIIPLQIAPITPATIKANTGAMRSAIYIRTKVSRVNYSIITRIKIIAIYLCVVAFLAFYCYSYFQPTIQQEPSETVSKCFLMILIIVTPSTESEISIELFLFLLLFFSWFVFV